ncbi:F-box/FBD/LRR-repeat protein At1g13570-like isoform X2 [Pyrus x bretschneideri]|nr:F-box/FBD/LRR-repeat protein At1g13570-like isoform X2 [Pyrus x bretschneideri]
MENEKLSSHSIELGCHGSPDQVDIKPPKSPVKMDMELDRISNLPSDIIGKILSHMPLREAVRTSVLSSNWMNKWTMLTRLQFDNRRTSSQNHTTFAKIVDHVLQGLVGPINMFEVTLSGYQASEDIDRWIIHLSRNSIKELVLNLHTQHIYNVSSYLFSCQNLIYLALLNCLLQPPPTFKGFRSLKMLGFMKVTLDQGVLENLITCCPLLEIFVLINCDGFTHLKIDAPNLSRFSFKGVFEYVSLVNTLKLANVRIWLTSTSTVSIANNQGRTAGSCSNLLNFFVHLPWIQRLRIEMYFLKYLGLGVLPEKMPQPLRYLKVLSIHIGFNDRKETLTALCLLRSVPALQELEILARKGDEDVGGKMNYALDDNQNCQLTQLRLLKITEVSGLSAELDFIKILLSSSPVLEKMIVEPAVIVGGFPEQVKKVLPFWCVSENAEIIYMDPWFMFHP